MMYFQNNLHQIRSKPENFNMSGSMKTKRVKQESQNRQWSTMPWGRRTQQIRLIINGDYKLRYNLTFIRAYKVMPVRTICCSEVILCVDIQSYTVPSVCVIGLIFKPFCPRCFHSSSPSEIVYRWSKRQADINICFRCVSTRKYFFFSIVCCT